MIRLPPDLTTISETRLQALQGGTWRELVRIAQRLRRAVPDFDTAVRNSDAVEAEMRRRGLPLPEVE